MRHIGVAMLAALLLLVSGCEYLESFDPDRAAAQIEHLEGDVEELRGLKAQLDERLEHMPEGDTRDAVAARADQVDAVLAEAEAMLPELREAMEAAEGDALAAVEHGAGALAPVLPAPWGAIVAGVAGLGVGLFRAARNRINARKVIQSVDEFVNPSEKAAARISAMQGAEGKRLVDEAEGKAPKRLV